MTNVKKKKWSKVITFYSLHYGLIFLRSTPHFSCRPLLYHREQTRSAIRALTGLSQLPSSTIVGPSNYVSSFFPLILAFGCVLRFFISVSSVPISRIQLCVFRFLIPVFKCELCNPTTATMFLTNSVLIFVSKCVHISEEASVQDS